MIVNMQQEILDYLNNAYKEYGDDVIDAVSTFYFAKMLEWSADDTSVKTTTEQRLFADMIIRPYVRQFL